MFSLIYFYPNTKTLSKLLSHCNLDIIKSCLRLSQASTANGSFQKGLERVLTIAFVLVKKYIAISSSGLWSFWDFKATLTSIPLRKVTRLFSKKEKENYEYQDEIKKAPYFCHHLSTPMLSNNHWTIAFTLGGEKSAESGKVRKLETLLNQTGWILRNNVVSQ